MDVDPTSHTRLVELMGTPQQINKAEQLINDVLSEAEAGGSGIVGARKFTSGQSGSEQFVMKVPNNKVGLIIGKHGESIKNMQARSGARIQVIPLHLPPGDTSSDRTVQIDGTAEQIESAKQLVNEVISEPGPRDTLLQCFIKRNRTTQTYYLYLGLTPALTDNGKFLLAARRCRRPTCTDYMIYFDADDMSKGSNTYIGKLRWSLLIGNRRSLFGDYPASWQVF